ncbi:MAG: Fe-S cluster assembly protein SufB, partial [Yersiniaceae bacterium]|nr:Fe-S cluster assembly protein SufB [Yersiniaceae bacterium]
MTRSNVEIPENVQAWVGEGSKYKEGFFTQLVTDELASGINEDVVRAISAKRNEPEWMLDFRLKAYHAWTKMEEPHWLKAYYKPLDYQDYSYYSAPSCGSCDDVCGSQPGATQQPSAADALGVPALETHKNYLTSEVEAAFNQLGVP